MKTILCVAAFCSVGFTGFAYTQPETNSHTHEIQVITNYGDLYVVGVGDSCESAQESVILDLGEGERVSSMVCVEISNPDLEQETQI